MLQEHKNRKKRSLGSGFFATAPCAQKNRLLLVSLERMLFMADIFDLFRQISSNKSQSTTPLSWIVVGLGNPGEEYRNTRHNAGFLTIDAFADSLGYPVGKTKGVNEEYDQFGKG